MQQPIVIPMEDELIHTQEHPYCNDPACPCHTTQAEQEHTPPQNARLRGRRLPGTARRKQRAAGSR